MILVNKQINKIEGPCKDNMPLHTAPERWIPSLHCMPPPIADSEAGPRKVPNAAEMVPITAPHVHVELTVATGLLRD